MLTWCVTLFILGVVAFFDSMFNYGEIFRRVNSVLFMLISLGLLVRTASMKHNKHMQQVVVKTVENKKAVAET